MAAVAVPLIEVAVSRLLIALGVGVVAGAANEAAKERARAQSDAGAKAQASPITRADACVQTAGGATAKAGADHEPCKVCPPDAGTLRPRKVDVLRGWVEYQERICGMGVGPGFINEWHYMGIEFDGFTSGECHLKEAKGHYAQFLVRNEETGDLEPVFYFKEFPRWLMQANRQAAVTRVSPPARLTWFIQETDVYTFMATALMRNPPLVAVYFP